VALVLVLVLVLVRVLVLALDLALALALAVVFDFDFDFCRCVFDLGFDLEEASPPPRQKRFPGRAAGMRREGALSGERIAPGPSGKGFC